MLTGSVILLLILLIVILKAAQQRNQRRRPPGKTKSFQENEKKKLFSFLFKKDHEEFLCWATWILFGRTAPARFLLLCKS